MPIVAALVATTIGALIAWSSDSAPRGLVAAMIMAAGHGLLVWRPARKPALPSVQVPRWLLAALSVIVVLLSVNGALVSVRMGVKGNWDPARTDLPMDGLSSLVEEFHFGGNPYRAGFVSDGGGPIALFPPGLVLPFRAIRELGWSPRYAGIGVASLLAGLCAWMLLRYAGQGSPARHAVCWLAVAALFDMAFEPMLANCESPLIVALPMFLGLGLAVSSGSAPGIAILGGLLASMSVGWMLLIPVLAMFLVRRPGAALWIAALVAIPAACYASAGVSTERLCEALVGSAIQLGESHADAAIASRFPTLHGLSDALGLRHLLYVGAVLAIIEIAIRLWRTDGAQGKRAEFLALASFVVVAFAPVASAADWCGHLALLLGLLPGSAGAESPPLRWRHTPAIGGGAMAVASLAMSATMKDPAPLAPDLKPRMGAALVAHLPWQRNGGSDRWLGATPVRVPLFVSDPSPARITLRISALDGEWVPPNPVAVLLNGRHVGSFAGEPGSHGTVVIDLPHRGDAFVGVNMLEFRAQWSRSPASFGIGDAVQPIAFRWDGFDYSPLPGGPE